MVKQWTITEFSNLYGAVDLLSLENKRTLGLVMPVEVYVQDPFVAQRNPELDVNTIEVTCEPDLADGPTSARIAVVDYNGDTDTLEAPAHWDAQNRCFAIRQDRRWAPITREHRDTPQFHQLNAWAIIQRILDIYQESWVLGRSAPWAFEGNRLIVAPHAGYLRNAYYDRHSKSMQLYYFDVNGQWVYTCLSHDIIAHETGHAILDGLRPYYLEDSSLQTTAFHEFVADLTAIITALLNNELRWVAAQAPEGDLDQDEIISGLAEEFGQYAINRPHLRSARNKNTLASVGDSASPYDWSEVLSGAMFEVLAGIFAKRLQKPIQGGGMPTRRQALSWAVNRFRRMALQPLDYLPPVDVQFGDYARAVLRADEVVYPADEEGYRQIIKQAFEGRGIDCSPDQEEVHFYGYDIDRVARSRTDAYRFLNENRRQLCIPAEQDISVVDLYRTAKTVVGAGRLPREIVVQYAWREDVDLRGAELGALDGERISLLCGGTVVFDERGNLLSWTSKPGTGKQETGQRQRAYADQQRAKGQQRRDELLAYVRRRVQEGYVGLRAGGRPGEVDSRPPVVASPAADGVLRLEVTPHLRHWAVEGGRR